MTHDHCHQSCKGESRTRDHSHTKLGTFRSTRESIGKFLMGSRFHVKLRILGPENFKQGLRVKHKEVKPEGIDYTLL